MLRPIGLGWALALALVGWTAPAAGAAEADALELDLRLDEAAVWGSREEPDVAHGANTLILLLKRAEGRWERAVGYSGGGPKTCHFARVTESSLTEQGLELTLDVRLSGDAWLTGARATYRVSLKRLPGGDFAGTYAGTCRAVDVKGSARASVMPARRKASGYVPVQRGEHPRILLRRHELAALKEKAATPLGRACLEKMQGPVALGLRYQLTGDERFAREAMEPVWKMTEATIYHSNFGGSGPLAEQIACTYDLCYAAWPPAFKRRVEGYLARYIHCTFHSHAHFLTSRINWHACSNYAGPIHTGAGFAGLALWGEKGPEPAKPAAPQAVLEIPPARDYAAGKGVPLVPLVPGKTPGKWLASEPVPVWMWEDPLADLGGMEQCRPREGTRFSDGLRDVAFAPLDPKHLMADGSVDLMSFVGTATHKEATVCFYAVLDNAEPRLLKVSCAAAGGLCAPEFVLGGRRVAEGQIVKLDKGLYPFLVVFRGSAKGTQPGFPPLDARLDPATEEDVRSAEARLPALEAEYREQLKDWEYDLAEWKRLEGAGAEYMRLFLESWLGVYLHYREGMGTGGFQAEVGHYSSNASTPPARYASAYRTMFGEDASPYEDVAAYLPRKMFAHLYRADGRPLAQDINGTAGVGPDVFASLYPVVREEWRPAALWAWDYHAGKGGVAAADPVRALLHYPADPKPRPPQGILPLTWQAPDFGYYGFRSSWEGRDDFIAQVFLKAHPIFGWNGPNGGTFRLLGLGHVWAHGPAARERCRWEENVVMLPEDAINESGCARLTHCRMEKDGSGCVSMDMSEIYSGAAAERLYEGYGGRRIDARLQESGIRGLRSIAVDYSGKSGAPCLLVLVDRITGGKSKVWLWQLGGASGGKGQAQDPDAHLADTRVDPDGRAFTITKSDGATLRATVVAPAKGAFQAEARKISFYNSHSGNMERVIPAVFATGAEAADGEFFVIVTIQRGRPPAVQVTGSGLDAKVTVGRRTIAFDGQQIVLGEP